MSFSQPVAITLVLTFWAFAFGIGWLVARKVYGPKEPRPGPVRVPAADKPLPPIHLCTSADAERWRRALVAIQRAAPFTIAADIARDALDPRPSPDGAPRGRQRSTRDAP